MGYMSDDLILIRIFLLGMFRQRIGLHDDVCLDMFSDKNLGSSGNNRNRYIYTETAHGWT